MDVDGEYIRGPAENYNYCEKWDIRKINSHCIAQEVGDEYLRHIQPNPVSL